jgi:hypothetical protein
MRNFRRTRKRGGAEVVFTCKKGRTSDLVCVQDFAAEFNFRFENVPSDGDCFFHTLERYYSHTGNTGANKGHQELRATIVNHILVNWDEYSAFGIDQTDILDLTEEGSWNNNAGDLVVPAASRALNIKINLYDLKPNPKRVIKYIYPENPPRPEQEINIVRINQGHFGLLVTIAPVAVPAPARRKPKVAPSNSPSSRPKKEEEKGNKKETTTALRRSTRLATAKKPSSPPKEASKSPSQTTTKKATSRRNRTSSLENAFMKLALQESEEQNKKNKEKQKKLNNNFFKALELSEFN